MSVRPSVRGVHDTGLSHWHSPSALPGLSEPLSFLFLVSFFLRSAGLWRSRAAWRRRQRIRLPHYWSMEEEEGKTKKKKKRKISGAQHQPPSIQPRPNLQHPTHQPVEPGVIYSIFLSSPGQEGVTAGGGGGLFSCERCERCEMLGNGFWFVIVSCNKHTQAYIWADSSSMHGWLQWRKYNTCISFMSSLKCSFFKWLHSQAWHLNMYTHTQRDCSWF